MFKATQYSILVILGAKLAIVDQKNEPSGQKIKINDTRTLKIWIKIKNLHVELIFNIKNPYFLEDIRVHFLHNVAT